MLVPVLLDAINTQDRCSKSDQNLAGPGPGRICQNWPDAGPAGAENPVHR